jgi:hypothetical protein
VVIFVLNIGSGFVFEFTMTFFEDVANGGQIVNLDGIVTVNEAPKPGDRKAAFEPAIFITATNVGEHGFGEIGQNWVNENFGYAVKRDEEKAAIEADLRSRQTNPLRIRGGLESGDHVGDLGFELLIKLFHR